MEYLNDKKFIGPVIIATLILLFSPNLGCCYKVFDYSFVHFVILYFIYSNLKNINVAIIITLVYMILVFQHQRIMMEELLDMNMINPDISTLARYKLSMRILSNDTISDNTKSNFVIRSMNSIGKAMYRLNILLSYMEKPIDKDLKREVLKNFYEKGGKNISIITTYMLEIDKVNNMDIIFESIVNSEMDKSVKMEIIKNMKCKINKNEVLKKLIKEYIEKNTDNK